MPPSAASLHGFLRGRARRITIDLDPTDDPTYGERHLALFNGHYGNWCDLPMACFLHEEPDQHLFAHVLRSGGASTTEGAVAILRRVLRRLRKAFPRVQIWVRLDGGFATPELFEFLNEQRVEYAVGMAKNGVLRAMLLANGMQEFLFRLRA